MPRIEVELDDKGEIVGDAPEALKGIFTRIETAAHGQGYGKGVAKAAEDAKKQIADTVALELAKKDALLPLERAKWAQIEEDNKSLQTRLIETTANTTGRSRRARNRMHVNSWTGRMRSKSATAGSWSSRGPNCGAKRSRGRARRIRSRNSKSSSIPPSALTTT
jgi:hypothetical protein